MMTSSLPVPNTTSHSHRTQQAFSLVELSIVLVIIGLLVGGVLIGRNLMRSAEINSIAKDKNTYVTAISTFRDKYNGLPGDLVTATRVWGAADSDFDACAALTTAATGTETCDGNGNNKISNASDAAEDHERHRAWQHLANAGLIGGKFSGVGGSGGILHAVPGQNCPSGALSGSCWEMVFIGAREADPILFDGIYDHVLFFGRSSAAGVPDAAILTPEDMWSLDKKIDDGKPAKGSLVVNGSYTNCVDAADPTELDSDYRVDNDTVACNAIFRNLLN